jgi:hypothetical protein
MKLMSRDKQVLVIDTERGNYQSVGFQALIKKSPLPRTVKGKACNEYYMFSDSFDGIHRDMQCRLGWSE